jgi:hypothetical protein
MRDFHDIGIVVALMDAGHGWLSCVPEGTSLEHAGRCMAFLGFRLVFFWLMRAYCGLRSTVLSCPVCYRLLPLLFKGSRFLPVVQRQYEHWTCQQSMACQQSMVRHGSG